MKRLGLAFALASTAAFAAMLAVDFTNLKGSVTGSGLRLSFTATGLSANTSAQFTGTADAKAVWGCFNRPGINPNAKNKRTTVEGDASGSVTLRTNDAGTASGALTLSVPRARNFSCPRGQSLALSSITYTNVRISNGSTTESVPGTFTKVLRAMK